MGAHYESAGVSVGFFHEGTSRDARSGGTSQHHRKHRPPRNSRPHGFGDPLLAHTPNSGPIWGQVSVQPPSSIEQGWRHLVPLVSAAGGKRSKQNVNNCACVVVQGENVHQTHRAADLMDIPELWRLKLSPKLLLEGEKGLQDACCPAIRANAVQAKKKNTTSSSLAGRSWHWHPRHVQILGCLAGQGGSEAGHVATSIAACGTMQQAPGFEHPRCGGIWGLWRLWEPLWETGARP